MIERTSEALETGMHLGSILAYVDGGESSDYVIKTAAELGEIHSCYVEVLHISKDVDTSLFAMDVGGSLVATTEIFQIMKEESENRKSRAKAAFDNYCSQMDVHAAHPDSEETLLTDRFSLSWNLVSGNNGRELAHRGRLFDLIVMAKATDQVGGVDSVQLEAALFDSGRPLLLATGGAVPNDKPTSIVIAWDGSREAAHSVALSMPFLSLADKVYVVSIGQREPGMEIKDLGRYLTRHGVNADYCEIASSKKAISHSLMDTSREKGSGLIVMGAYGHSALGESLFGGVTRDLLENGELQLFLAH